MDFVFWIVLIVLVVGVVWWLLNRSSSPNTSDSGGRTEGMRADGALEGGSAAASADAAAVTGMPSAAGFGRSSEPAPPATADEAPELSVPASRDAGSGPQAATGNPSQPSPPAQESVAGQENARHDDVAGQEAERRREEDAAEWDTQWSEASGSTPAPRTETQQGDPSLGSGAEPPAAPVHHPEYTGPHSPTLPGAETAAVEDADEAAGQANGTAGTEEGGEASPIDITKAGGGMAPPDVPGNAAATETLDRTQSSAAVETSASHSAEPPAADAERESGAEPSSHLDAEEPYGQGSASPAPDGSGPADYAVKGDPGSMTYYEEGHPDYEQTRAGVWFESPAHAEAAGFRAPRRKRL